jgi:hypothetical protein
MQAKSARVATGGPIARCAQPLKVGGLWTPQEPWASALKDPPCPAARVGLPPQRLAGHQASSQRHAGRA